MTVNALEKIAVVPFSLRDAPSLIERAWPTAKISAETQKERKANLGQTLTALGSYWKGRKMLVLNRACVLGALMPATDDLERDVEVFEKLMGMADETFGRRFTDGPTSFAKLFPEEAAEVASHSGRSWIWRDDLTAQERERRIGRAFLGIPYSIRLESVKRPEEIDEEGLLEGVWQEVNAHLGTSARSISELVRQLGIMRFGRTPRVGDAFCGSGQIPFEAARMGCDAFASDLNPIACMLTWGAKNIIAAVPDRLSEIVAALNSAVTATIQEIDNLDLETDSRGNRAKAYLYCVEVLCPYTGWWVPLAPSWVISKKRNVVAKLHPDVENKKYKIEVVSHVSEREMAMAESGTIQAGRLAHPALKGELGPTIKDLRDRKAGGSMSTPGLRLWEENQFCPSSEDIFQERLYAIHWIDGVDIKKGKANPKTWFASPIEADLEREERVKELLSEKFDAWQQQGLIPEMEIEDGANTTQPIRERGWKFWHQAFMPRHLVMNAILRSHFVKGFEAESSLVLCRSLNVQSKMSRWSPAAAHELALDVFYNQALNTFYNYGCRATVSALRDFSAFSIARSCELSGSLQIQSANASEISVENDVWITDPPYADAVNYDEITEYFIAWLRRNPPQEYSDWTWDSRRAVAVKGDGQKFKLAMIQVYQNLAKQMPDNGIQIVQFTHQDAKTWSDMAQIFWGAGLQVVQDWYVSTENMTELKKGGYVQGTHIIVLKKRQSEQSGYQDEIVHEIRDEVERQIREMIGLNDQMDAARGENIFNDADLQMAGYAAALRVLTAYTKIDGQDMTREALRPRTKGEKTLVDELTEFAVQTANEFLVPEGLERELWLELNGAERFYLKMMDIEEAGEAKLDQFQNFAKAFRVGEYDDLMASKTPNNSKLKTAKGLGRGAMAEGVQFGRDSIVRLAMRGVWRVAKGDEVEEILEELRDFIPEYLRKRDSLRQLAAYVAAKRELTEPEEASAARILGTAIQMERI